MESSDAIAAFAALAQETRLAVFRLLMVEGPGGLSAGEIARRLDAQPATLSFHLQHLERAGLLTRHRQSRQIFYAADVEGVRRLLSFLTEDCCQGRPEICGDLAAVGQFCRREADDPAPQASAEDNHPSRPSVPDRHHGSR